VGPRAGIPRPGVARRRDRGAGHPCTAVSAARAEPVDDQSPNERSARFAAREPLRRYPRAASPEFAATRVSVLPRGSHGSRGEGVWGAQAPPCRGTGSRRLSRPRGDSRNRSNSNGEVRGTRPRPRRRGPARGRSLPAWPRPHAWGGRCAHGRRGWGPSRSAAANSGPGAPASPSRGGRPQPPLVNARPRPFVS
jgi:hypothetical protein